MCLLITTNSCFNHVRCIFETFCKFPDVLLLNVSKFEIPTKSNVTDEYITVNNEFYQLCGVLDHLGIDQFSGHWITWSRSKQAEKGWMLCDDGLIKSTSIHEVLNRNNYILAYQKCYEDPQSVNIEYCDYLSTEVSNILQNYKSTD